MEKSGLLNEMQYGVSVLAEGRRKLYSKGAEVEGLERYLKGYEIIVALFKESIASDDVELMILTEFFYTISELHESKSNEPVAINSAQVAVRKFEEALHAVRIVVDVVQYHAVHYVFSTDKTFRYKNMPKDAYHIACLSDRVRVKNGLSRMGLSSEDRKIALARIELLDAAQVAYIEWQKKSKDST